MSDSDLNVKMDVHAGINATKRSLAATVKKLNAISALAMEQNYEDALTESLVLGDELSDIAADVSHLQKMILAAHKRFLCAEEKEAVVLTLVK